MKQLLLIICVLALGACTYEPKDVDNINVPNYASEDAKTKLSAGIVDTVIFVETDGRHFIYDNNGKLIKRYRTDFTGDIIIACILVGLFVFVIAGITFN